MYIPKHFAEDDTEKLFDFLQTNSFGILFASWSGQPFATHLPFLVEREAGSNGWLLGHMARANPHWQELEGEVLVVFPGPHAYISPAWYEEEKVVPTWNYVAVHVYGQISVTHDEEVLARIVKESVSFYEAGRPAPWVLDTSTDYFRNMLKGIVGFKIEITRLEGKWKLSQNHPVARQEKVVQALRLLADQNSGEIADLMESRLLEKQKA